MNQKITKLIKIGKKIIKPENLLVGDIILTTTNKPTSKLVRYGTNSDISHAMLYVAENSILDSTDEGVQGRNLQKEIFDENCQIYGLRLKRGLSSEELSKISEYARSQIGVSYSIKEAVSSVKSEKPTASKKQFCSRFVARAYESAGIKLCDDPDYCTPDDLKKSDQLSLISDIEEFVSDEYVKTVEKSKANLDTMRNCTNILLKKARTVARSVSFEINSVSDIDKFLINYRNFDTDISNAFKESGYLDFWKNEIDLHPYRYDKQKIDDLIINEYATISELTVYCQKTIASNDDGTFNHWFKMLDAYNYYYSRTKLITFKLLIETYTNICSYHVKRVEVANYFLDKYSI